MLQKRATTPSKTYFKHTVYGLRFLLKSQGLPYSYLHLPEIKSENKLPVVLSKQEVWQMIKGCTLLKHKILIGLLYGCGLRCMEVRSYLEAAKIKPIAKTVERNIAKRIPKICTQKMSLLQGRNVDYH